MDEKNKKYYHNSNLIENEEGKENEFLQQRHRSFGRCYTFHPHSRARSLGVYYVRVRTNADAKFYIHMKGQFMDLSGRMGHKVR